MQPTNIILKRPEVENNDEGHQDKKVKKNPPPNQGASTLSSASQSIHQPIPFHPNATAINIARQTKSIPSMGTATSTPSMGTAVRLAFELNQIGESLLTNLRNLHLIFPIPDPLVKLLGHLHISMESQIKALSTLERQITLLDEKGWKQALLNLDPSNTKMIEILHQLNQQSSRIQSLVDQKEAVNKSDLKSGAAFTTHCFRIINKIELQRNTLKSLVTQKKTSAEENSTEILAKPINQEEKTDAVQNTQLSNTKEEIEKPALPPLPTIPNLLFSASNKQNYIPRKELEDRIVEIIRAPFPPLQSVLLVGPPGVGKTTLIINCLKRLPAAVHTSSDAIISLVREDRFYDNIKEKLTSIFTKLIDYHRENSEAPPLLIIKKIDPLFSDKVNLMSSYMHTQLNEGHFNIIATTTPEGYRNALEKDPCIKTHFEIIKVEEMDKETTLKAAKLVHSTISSDLINQAYHLAQRYFPQAAQPRSTIQLLAYASRRADFKKVPLTREVLLEIIADQLRIPLSKIQDQEITSALSFKERLSRSVVGQSYATETVAKAITLFKTGFNNPNKPPGVFVFAGPTGVGKTELAKSIAEILFGDANQLTRLDMGEYHSDHTKARLIGAPPGYIGYNDGGQLTSAIKQKPSSVVLLDEIEKAHPDVLKLFLPVFDEGRITDSSGVPINCKNTFFIMTTNLGAQEIMEKAASEELKIEEIKNIVKPLLSKKFGPEWLNRVELIPFLPISQNVCEEIVTVHLNKLKIEFLSSKNITISWSQKLVSFLAKQGFNPQMGARTLIREIDQKMRLALAESNLSDSGSSLYLDELLQQITVSKLENA